MTTFRMADLKPSGRGTCSTEHTHGPITKDHYEFLETGAPDRLNLVATTRYGIELERANRELAARLERLEGELLTAKTCANGLQASLMVLRDAAQQTTNVHDVAPGSLAVSIEIEALHQRVCGANAVLATYGQDPY